MKAVLFLGVVALVAGQPGPWPEIYEVDFSRSPCQHTHGWKAGCCLDPRIAPLGCMVPPGYPLPPPGVPLPRPDPFFLELVCCQRGKTCCQEDLTQNWQPTFTCCRSNEVCEHGDDSKGTCRVLADGEEAPPSVPQTDDAGRCPDDGALPFMAAPDVPFRCSLTENAQAGNFGNCPSDHTCVRDQGFDNMRGVCCREGHCNKHSTCKDCVTNKDQLSPFTSCSWLSQGDLYNVNPRCMADCAFFPGASCVLPGDIQSCPRSDANPEGLIINTGTCAGRCGMVGTGRSSRITNNGNKVEWVSPSATGCCKSNPGDFCCDITGVVANHCVVGRPPSGQPLCGIPVRGTENNFFNSPPPPPPMWARPPMWGGMWGGSPWFPSFGLYRSYGQSGDENREAAELEDNERNYFFAPSPFGWRPDIPRPAPTDQQFSDFICSCDALSLPYDETSDVYFYNDRCSDYDNFCSLGVDVDEEEL